MSQIMTTSSNDMENLFTRNSSLGAKRMGFNIMKSETLKHI